MDTKELRKILTTQNERIESLLKRVEHTERAEAIKAFKEARCSYDQVKNEIEAHDALHVENDFAWPSLLILRSKLLRNMSALHKAAR